MHFHQILSKAAVLTALFLLDFSPQATASPVAEPADPNSAPSLATRYVGGSCGVHLTQYQKNEGPAASTGGTSNYRFDILVKDGRGTVVGSVYLANAPEGYGVRVHSGLPWDLIATAESVDSNPVKFAYANQFWDSNSHCSVGAYDSGSRQMDCGFTC